MVEEEGAAAEEAELDEMPFEAVTITQSDIAEEGEDDYGTMDEGDLYATKEIGDAV